MLAETYEKFKSQLKARKTSNEQLPEVVQTSDEQVHYIYAHTIIILLKMMILNQDLFIMMSIILMSLHMNLNMASSKTLLKASN